MSDVDWWRVAGATGMMWFIASAFGQFCAWLMRKAGGGANWQIAGAVGGVAIACLLAGGLSRGFGLHHLFAAPLAVAYLISHLRPETPQ